MTGIAHICVAIIGLLLFSACDGQADSGTPRPASQITPSPRSAARLSKALVGGTQVHLDVLVAAIAASTARSKFDDITHYDAVIWQIDSGWKVAFLHVNDRERGHELLDASFVVYLRKDGTVTRLTPWDIPVGTQIRKEGWTQSPQRASLAATVALPLQTPASTHSASPSTPPARRPR